MFIKRKETVCYTDVGNKIGVLEDRLDELNNKDIGEVYCERCNSSKPSSTIIGWCTIDDIPLSIKKYFYEFKYKDVTDDIEDNIKIFGHWHSKKDVFYYDDVYKTKRDRIKKRGEK